MMAGELERIRNEEVSRQSDPIPIIPGVTEYNMKTPVRIDCVQPSFEPTTSRIIRVKNFTAVLLVP